MNEQDWEEIVKYDMRDEKPTDRASQSGILSFMVCVGRREYGDFSSFD